VEGAEDESCFGLAETEAGTKDIMEVAGFLTEAGVPLKPGLFALAHGAPPLGLGE